jgi:hypothetical protein
MRTVTGEAVSRYLTADGKAKELARWHAQVADESYRGQGGYGFPDPPMFKWCERLNAIDGVATLQSCAGHVGELRADGVAYNRSQAGIWLWLSERLATECYRRADELTAATGAERGLSFLFIGEREVVNLDFDGDDQGPGVLDASMERIAAFFESLPTPTEDR